MSLALSTIFLFVLLLPGIAFRRLYYSEEFSQQYFRDNFFLVFTATIVPGLVFQLLGLWIAGWFNPVADLTVLRDLVSGAPGDAAMRNLEDYLGWILLHQAFLIALAAALGYAARKVVRNNKWDRRYKLFRYRNTWHYVLKGEFFDFPRADYDLAEDTVDDIEVVSVTAVQDTGMGTLLYVGLLVDYELGQDGGLQTISLKSTQRRLLTEDALEGGADVPGKRFYPVKGHIMLLKYAELRNLNFTYITLEEREGVTYPRQVR